MGDEVDSVDVIIKIRKLDNYRTKTKTSAQDEPVQSSFDRLSTSGKTTSVNGTLETKILSFVEKHPEGIKAREIADKLRLDKSKVNSLLYSLKYRGICKIDELYKWTLQKNKPNTFTPSAKITYITPNATAKIDETNETLGQYVNNFEHLSVGIRGDLRAPHKYVLLIAVLNLIQRGVITSNRFKPSQIIDEEFKEIWASVVKVETPFKPHPAYPYWHMMSEPFWKLYSNAGCDISAQWVKPILSEVRQRKELNIELDYELFTLAKKKQTCDMLIAALIRCYNSPIPTMITDRYNH